MAAARNELLLKQDIMLMSATWLCQIE